MFFMVNKLQLDEKEIIKLYNSGLSPIKEENNIKTLEESIYCDELWNINNGITLCIECHKKTHKKE